LLDARAARSKMGWVSDAPPSVSTPRAALRVSLVQRGNELLKINPRRVVPAAVHAVAWRHDPSLFAMPPSLSAPASGWSRFRTFQARPKDLRVLPGQASRCGKPPACGLCLPVA
jgi:hypothetical protein